MNFPDELATDYYTLVGVIAGQDVLSELEACELAERIIASGFRLETP